MFVNVSMECTIYNTHPLSPIGVQLGRYLMTVKAIAYDLHNFHIQVLQHTWTHLTADSLENCVPTVSCISINPPPQTFPHSAV